MASWTNATPAAPGARLGATSSRAGILRPDELPRYATLERIPPHPLLAPWVEWYWTVCWDLPPGATYRSEVLPHPALNLALEGGTGVRHGFGMPAALVHGVVTSRFEVDLSGSGWVVAAKFRPGGFGAFTGSHAGRLLGRVVEARDVFGESAVTLLREAVAASAERRQGLLEAYLLARIPEADSRYEQVLVVVADMLEDRGLTRVEDVAERHGLTLRSLQRLFHRYVGVSPKWVLQRYRLHDAVSLIDAGEVDDLAGLAARLGWYDQAHFTREFTALVGMPPARYAARAVTPVPR